jgi:hypothetical protein
MTTLLMADDLDRDAPYRARIDVGDRYEVSWWATELGVDADTLKDLVKAVGPFVEDVRRLLKSRSGTA